MEGIAVYSDIQKLKKMGYKKQRAARQLKIDTKTVHKYWDMSEDEYVSYFSETKERSKIMDPYYDYVLDRLTTYPEITSAIIYDNLREDFHNFAPSYRSVRLYVFYLREKEGIPAPTKIRQYGENPELPFGYQAQVDMGQKTMKDANGKSVKVYVFAMVLSSSRYKYVCFQLEPFTAATFIQAHNMAFRFFGGRPSEIVYDQDRIMVISENGGDIIYTETFENYKNYTGFSVYLCRGSDPESKGKIEAVVKYVKNNFLSCRVFHAIARLNSDGMAWLDRTGNGLVHETTKMVPAVVFAQEQKHLKAVPELSEPSIVPKIAIVRKNNMVMYRQNRYCMPKGTYQPGRNVRIETDERGGGVSFFDLKDNTLIEEHKIHHGVGKCVRNNHADRDRHTKLRALKDKVFSRFVGYDQAIGFVQKIVDLKPRYVRDQLVILHKLQEQYSTDELLQAVEYCLERNLFSANDFRDTLEFFKEKDPVFLVAKVEIPIKYRVIVAQVRPIEVYANLCRVGEKR
jgi:transposase